MSAEATSNTEAPLKVLLIGGGNWGTVLARICAQNVTKSSVFDNVVHMWLHEEDFEGRPLTEVINERHENPRYLPGFELPPNLVATPDLVEASEVADLIVFVIPHQFVEAACNRLKGHVKPSAKALSCVKGLLVEDGQPILFSRLISKSLGIPCSILSGANVANDIAHKLFSETTLGFPQEGRDAAPIWQKLLDTPYFKVNGLPDLAGVEVCGAIKNVVAIAAGFCDGLNYKSNTKAAVIRNGVIEMRLFANVFFDNILEDTFFDSAGYADVITTCFGGRNVRCAAEFVRRQGQASWVDIENDLLGGQKLQGHLTCEEVYSIIRKHRLQKVFPMFTATYKIAFKNADPNMIVDFMKVEDHRALKDSIDCVPSVLPLQVLQKLKERTSSVPFHAS